MAVEAQQVPIFPEEQQKAIQYAESSVLPQLLHVIEEKGSTRFSSVITHIKKRTADFFNITSQNIIADIPRLTVISELYCTGMISALLLESVLAQQHDPWKWHATTLILGSSLLLGDIGSRVLPDAPEEF